MAESLRALCRGGGWSYAAIWRSDHRDPRLLTIGECHCEDEAREVVLKMLNQVHVVGEGIIGRALVSGECQWISDNSFSLVQTSDADNSGFFQGYTWWQHQFLSGIKNIALVPIPAFGVAQFGSMQKVSKSLEFLDLIKGTFCQRESIVRDPSSEDIQINILPYNQRYQLNSLTSTDGLVCVNADLENKKVLGNTVSVESLGSLVSYSSKYSRSSPNGLISYESCNSTNPHIVAMPVNSKSINAVRVFHNSQNFLEHNIFSGNPIQSKSTEHLDSSLASATMGFSSLSNLPRVEQELSCVPNKLGHCLQSENSSSFQSLFSSYFSAADELKPIVLENASSFVSETIVDDLTPPHAILEEPSLILDPRIGSKFLASEENIFYCKDSQNGLMQALEPARFTFQDDSAVHEFSNELLGETAPGTLNSNSKGNNGSFDLMDSTIFEPIMQDWWDDNGLLAGIIPHCSATTTNSVEEHANTDPLSVDDQTPMFSEPVLEELVGASGNSTLCGPIVDSADTLSGFVSDRQLSMYTLQDSFSVCKAQAPSMNFPSSSYTSEHVPNVASKVIPESLRAISMDACCSLNTANSKVSQANAPDGVKFMKKRARPGESTRPRPKDRQHIQDRVKELREIVPNSAKCSIDALLDRTIKHMLFLQSVSKYAEKIKQADVPKMISKDSDAILKENSSGVVLKDNTSTGSNNGGTTWAYEVAGQTMVCPIIVEDLSPPGQMLVEMLCEERGFFLEIADTIRGFGLTILKGLMELRDGKIMARFLVEANKNVTRMDIFLSLVQLLQQNILNRSSDEIDKVIKNGVPSFMDHQQSPISVQVGLAER